MDPAFQTVLDEWRTLDDLMREAEIIRPRWSMLSTILNNLVQAYPNEYPVELVQEIRAPFGPTPRKVALENQGQAQSLSGAAAVSGQSSGSLTITAGTPTPRVQMWPLAQRIIAEKGPMRIDALHRELVARAWKPTFDMKDRRVLYNTLMAMNTRFAKVDDKWTNLQTNTDEL